MHTPEDTFQDTSVPRVAATAAPANHARDMHKTQWGRPGESFIITTMRADSYSYICTYIVAVALAIASWWRDRALVSLERTPRRVPLARVSGSRNRLTPLRTVFVTDSPYARRALIHHRLICAVAVAVGVGTGKSSASKWRQS